MLSLTATNDKRLLNGLHNAIFGGDIDGNVGYVLIVDEVPAGVAKLDISANGELTEAHIKEVGILPKLRGKGYGDFFTRSLMNVLIDVTDVIIIDYADDYYLQFGFTREGDRMRIASDKLTFPHKCKH